jgi:hypothetical protein
MQTIKVDKAKLIATLEENRAKHRKIFEEACDGYQKAVIKELEAQLNRAKAGIRRNIQINILAPVDQTKEYDRAIAMLKMSVDNQALLSEQDFQCYVLDDWAWKQNFLARSSSYSPRAAMALNAEDEVK